MSEAELHIIKARLQGGIVNKARRGELKMRLPIGLVYDINEKVILDPDQQVQDTIKTLFNAFIRTGSACATVKYFKEKDLKFPRKPNAGYGKDETIWVQLDHARVLQALHNPRYAGVFVFGRTKTRKDFEGKSFSKKVADEEWEIVIPNAHVGYISWETYISNKKTLQDNAYAHSLDRRKSPPREGIALLQGITVCGICGTRMTVRYKKTSKGIMPQYLCQLDGIKNSIKICQHIPGDRIDEVVGKQLLEMVNPSNLEVSLAVETELHSRAHEADKLRKQENERVRYETELARRRYLRVDPDNRLVADALEADWNEKLRAYQVCLEDYEQKCKAESSQLDEKKIAKIRELAFDFPKVWNNPKVPHRERKRLVRLLIEDVTLIKGEQISIHIRFKGGTSKIINISKPKPAWEQRQTTPEVINMIDKLLDQYTDVEIAQKLNERGLNSGMAQFFHAKMVWRLRNDYHLKSLYERLRKKGLLNSGEIAKLLNVKPSLIKLWRQKGIIKGVPYTDRPDFLYEEPGDNYPIKGKWKCRCLSTNSKVITDSTKEVQYAT